MLRKLLRAPRSAIALLTNPGSTLAQKTARASAWLLVLRVSERLLNASRTLVLAKLLAPADFGLFGVAALVLAALDYFTFRGTGSALIKLQGDIKPYLNTAWTIQVVRGLAVAALLIAGAPLISWFFDSPEATDVVRVVAITVAISGLANIGIVYFDRDLEFQNRFVLRMAYALSAAITGIILAFVLRSVWALVFAEVAGRTVRVLATYYLHSYRPRFQVDRARLGELADFGKWVFGVNLLRYTSEQLDRFLIGRVLGVGSLGYYAMADQITDGTVRQAAGVVGQVAFPVYSRLQEDKQKFKRAYLRVLQMAAVTAFPFAALFFAASALLVEAVLHEKWLPAAPVLELLAVWGVLRTIVSNQGPAFYAMGRPDMELRMNLLTLALNASLMYPFIRWWGIEGAVYALLISAGINAPIGLFINTRGLGVSLREVVRAFAVPVLGAAAVYLACRGVIVIWGPGATFVGATLVCLAGLAAYLSVTLIADHLIGTGIRKQMMRLVSRRSQAPA
jgi:O-antigen/teichoic acid export membrane protein